MKPTQMASNNPFRVPQPDSNPKQEKDEWEDWTDDEDGSPSSTSSPQDLMDFPEVPSHRASRGNPNRLSVQRPMRVKSKGRQKAQNAKAGIKLITDMSTFRRPGHQAQVLKSAGPKSATHTRGKFSDATALQALEGDPTSASIGNFAWLRRNKLSPKTASPGSGLSPGARPIMIGISMPGDDTSTMETPIDGEASSKKVAYNKAQNNHTLTPEQQRSVWSPDSDVSESPYATHQATASSVYSQPSVYGAGQALADAPPVPTIPATIKFKQNIQQNRTDAEADDELDTPCTLFEEDGSPCQTRKSLRPRATPVELDSASSRSHGWWDHVTTPFSAKSSKMNPFSRQQPAEASSSVSPNPQDWWSRGDEKKTTAPAVPNITVNAPDSVPEASSSAQVHTRSESQSEKAQILLEENQSGSEQPPPYSAHKPSEKGKVIAIPPPSQASMYQQSVDSPGPMTPGLPGTMTSQGGISMSEIPLTPGAPNHGGVLPDRPLAAYVIGDQFRDARGPEHKTERQRRRHEKEEAMARKVGGFWRGRWGFSENGCFGRTGREGRKRRRVCLGALVGVIAAIILAVVLALVVFQGGDDDSQGSGHNGNPDVDEPAAHQPTPTSVFLNLTNFPPMPTGVFKVAGATNTVEDQTCMGVISEPAIEGNGGTAEGLDPLPAEAWSCSLSKEDQKGRSLNANQPTFYFQIQHDDDPRDFWDVTHAGEQPGGSGSNDKRKNRMLKRGLVYAPGISPDPKPPSEVEMTFLGQLTDGVQSPEKAGEPTPFYMSLLSDASKLAPETGDAPNVRDSDPYPLSGTEPILNPAKLNGGEQNPVRPSRMLPANITQQPLRLYDRGLETEHYGFYTYFDKSIFLSTVSYNSTDKKTMKKDSEGGAPVEEAEQYLVMDQTRFLVQMWTRKGKEFGGDADLLDNSSSSPEEDESQPLPYPITITEDLHGGDPSFKKTWSWPLIPIPGAAKGTTYNATADWSMWAPSASSGGSVKNPFHIAVDYNENLGVIDAGTGGCKCEWQNFKL